MDSYRPVESKTEEGYSVEDYKYLSESEPMRLLFDKLRKIILNIDSQVKEEFKKVIIAYETTENIVSIIPQKNNLKLQINLKFEEIDDPKGLCRNVANVGKWGQGEVELKVSEPSELDYGIFLIKQAVEKASED